MAKKKARRILWEQAVRNAIALASLGILVYLSAGYGYHIRNKAAEADAKTAYGYGVRDGKLTCGRSNGANDWLRTDVSSSFLTFTRPMNIQMRLDF